MELDDRHGSTGGGTTGHPGLEMLAAYLDQRLNASQAAEIERHASACDDCREVLSDTAGFLETVQPVDGTVERATVVNFRQRRLPIVVAALAAAAALVLAVQVTQPQWLNWLIRSGGPANIENLVAALANETTRPVEGLLTGLPYGPPPETIRGITREVMPDVRIAAARIERLVAQQDTPANRAALGVAYLAVGDIDGGVSQLELAAGARQGDARFLSDLSAAYLADASVNDRPDRLPMALATAERALAANATLIEACFNRALALERLARR